MKAGGVRTGMPHGWPTWTSIYFHWQMKCKHLTDTCHGCSES